MSDIWQRLQVIFQDVFDDDELELSSEMTAEDVVSWDSLEHINLLISTEKEFNIKFTTAEVSLLKEKDQNVGSFIELITKKLSDNT